MQNNCHLQDCSDKHKRIILVVPLFTCACKCNVQIRHSVPKDPGLQVFFLTWKKKLDFPQSNRNLVQALASVLVVFGSVTKIIYDVVKVVHHSPCGAPICFFVFPLREIAEFGVCDVCDS